MIEEKIEELNKDFSLLLEAGFLAVKQLDEIGAMRIFQAAQALRPSHSFPQVGMGYIALEKLEIKKATKIFEGIIQKEPDNHIAQMLLGVCFLLTKGKLAVGEKLIKEIIKKTQDASIKNLGAVLIKWIEQDLSKKSKAPFFNAETEEKK